MQTRSAVSGSVQPCPLTEFTEVLACVALECSEPARVGHRLGRGPQGLVLCLRRGAARAGLSAAPQLAARISLECHTRNFGG